MTKEALESILNNSEFTECINEAAPYRVKIIQDISPQMREVQDEFLQTMISANHKGVAKIMERLKQDKKDEEAKDEYSKWKKSTMNLFRATLKTIHPNENQIPSIGMLYVAGSLLTYIGREDLITGNENYDKDNPLKFKKFEDINPFFNDDNVKAKMQQIFADADEIQGEMCKNADIIKKDIFQKLPASVKFDKDLNKKGLKEGHFQALVRHKAMGIIKDKDKYTKYISSQVENSNNNIDREEVILGKTEQM
jgi:hypothetical protein